MLLGYCRKPYPDELLYGYISSVFRMNGYSNMAQINACFKNGRIGVDFAVGLPFVKNTIDNKTFPDVKQMISMMPVASVKAAEYALQPPKTCFSLPATIRKLLVCPECIKDDTRIYGEAILHLSHNLGNKQCSVHNCNLQWRHVPHSTKELKSFNDYEYINIYTENCQAINQKTNNYVWSVCDKCGKQYLQHTESIKRNTGCPFCNITTPSEIIAQRMLNALYGTEYRITEPFESIRTANVEHLPCGIVSMKLFQLLNEKQTECKECKSLIPAYLQRRFDPEKQTWLFMDTDPYDRKRRRIHALHKACGKESFLFMPQFTSKEGGYCPYCDNPQKRIEIADVDPEYEIYGDYKNNREAIMIKHKTCGVVFEVSKTSFLAGARCPVCTPRFDFNYVQKAVCECCPGWKIRKETKRGMATLIKPDNEVLCGYSYGIIMNELKAETSVLFYNRTRKWIDTVSIRKAIYDCIRRGTENKGYWCFFDGLDEVTDPCMPGGISRERRNIIQDMARNGYIERCGKGCYRVVYK